MANKADDVSEVPLARRLIEAAIEQFGRTGFDGASTREIARASGTAMSSITYHFGGKEGLYLACADHIADLIGSIHADGLAAMRSNPPRDAEAARGYAMVLITNFARFMLAPESETCAQFITREQQKPTEAFERLYTRVMEPVLTAALSLVAIARPSLDEQARRVLVMNAVGMALVLRLGRACVSRVMQVEDIDAVTAETLIAGLRRSVLHLLTED